MIRKYVLLAFFILSFSGIIGVVHAAVDQTDTLPIELTEEERGRLDEIGIRHIRTAPPSGVIRNPAEWEPSEGVIIRWPLGLSYNLIAEMSEDLLVTTIVGSSSQETTARNAYASNGVTMSNVQFIIAPTNSIWTRDYGPWFIFEDMNLAIVDHIYNRPRPLDDVIPQIIGSEWGMSVYGLDLEHAGGNYMSDGLERSMSTRLVYDENPDLAESEIQQMIASYLGNEYTVLDYIVSGGIHHIDCWAKFLNPSTVLVKDVAPSDPSYSLLNARAAYLSQMISPWNRHYTVARIYSPAGTAYTNSVILNNKVFVPLFTVSTDAAALQVYQDLMPGYEVHGYTGSWASDDAIHCRTMGVPDRGMLFIDHVPLSTDVANHPPLELSATIIPYSGAPLVMSEMTITYRVDGGLWQSVPLASTNGDHTYSGTIPIQVAGSRIDYFIHAGDESGRVENHPPAGAMDPHSFSVATPVPALSPWAFVTILLLMDIAMRRPLKARG